MSSPLNVLIITPDSKLGGAERNIALLAGAMPRDACRLSLATTFGTGDLVRIFRERSLSAEEFRYAEDPRRVVELFRYVEKLKPDVIHSFLLRGNWIARALKLRLPHVPWIASERGLDITRPAWKAGVNRWMLSNADLVLAVSEPVRQILIDRDALPAEKIRVLHGGVSPAEPPLPLPADFPDLPRPRIVAVGHLRPEKNQALAIAALAKARHAGSTASLTLFGDGPERARLDTIARDLGISGVVHFAGNVLNARRMLSHFDLLILPSKEEGFPNVMLEAWQAGIAVLSTDTPGAREISGPDDAACLVSAADMPEALMRILAEAGERVTFAERGRSRLHAFTIDTVISQLLEHYRRLTKK